MEINKPIKSLKELSMLLNEPFKPVVEAVVGKPIVVEPLVMRHREVDYETSIRLYRYERDGMLEELELLGDAIRFVSMGVETPVYVDRGVFGGTVRICRTDGFIGLKVVRTWAYKGALDAGAHKVDAGKSAETLVDMIMKMVIRNGADTIDIRPNRQLNADYIQKNGLETYPVLAHQGGRLYLTLKTRPIKRVVKAPSKWQLLSDDQKLAKREWALAAKSGRGRAGVLLA